MNILWIPHAPWHVPQRARFFAEALAERHRVHVTHWDTDFRRVGDYLSLRYLRNFRRRTWQERGVTLTQVPRFSPALFSRRLRDLNSRVYRRVLADLIEREGIDVVVGSFVVPPPPGVARVLDVFDDNVNLWQTGGGHPGYVRDIEENEQAWLRSGQGAVAVSSVLAEQVQDRFPEQQVTHVPNAVDLRRFVPDRARARRELGLRENTRYVGNIGALDRREEADRLLAVAERLRGERGTELLVVGRGAALPYLERQLARRALSKVRCVGFLTGDVLLRYFQSLDVGLCPYRATPADHVRSPMRLLHYSAVGARVVSPRLREVERMAFGNVTLTDDDDEAFAEGVLTSLDRPAGVPSAIAGYDQQVVGARYEAALSAAVKRGSGGSRT